MGRTLPVRGQAATVIGRGPAALLEALDRVEVLTVQGVPHGEDLLTSLSITIAGGGLVADQKDVDLLASPIGGDRVRSENAELIGEHLRAKRREDQKPTTSSRLLIRETRIVGQLVTATRCELGAM